ncbi:MULTISPECIES: glycine zipper 2TM domain-containing protein [unclassified Nitratiruptor]|uniref:glycine zipper 2TM domain-containing protein n=1 Tax=unclassified Nitratiruptor TaxID=2624044 RepID=UPI001914F9B0|nr:MULTISPECIES: glycine zipper 2TM domain-containing protein [unclassified Nitratiruptor]BCD59714.1 hypothetical protein NitYY0810_C0466 [Nitratiruptor sp. YY08-10]BCD63638.1 hypothetical protein NitYY0814_C0466 [Nitratiruptor sp. YY08-14]
MKKLLVLLSVAIISQLFAEVITFTKSVPVYKSVEVERVVTKRVPYEECWYEEIPEDESSDGTVGAIIGGAAGGIIGHQIGGGSGKTAATIGGAIIGSLVGKNLAERNARPGYRTVKRCRTRYKETQEHVYEYKNYARVMGRDIMKYSNRPLRRIRVRVTLEY